MEYGWTLTQALMILESVHSRISENLENFEYQVSGEYSFSLKTKRDRNEPIINYLRISFDNRESRLYCQIVTEGKEMSGSITLGPIWYFIHNFKLNRAMHKVRNVLVHAEQNIANQHLYRSFPETLNKAFEKEVLK